MDGGTNDRTAGQEFYICKKEYFNLQVIAFNFHDPPLGPVRAAMIWIWNPET
jgi:hypothetical protein